MFSWLTSAFGALAHPLFLASAWLIAAVYAVFPDYATAIAVMPVIVLTAALPFTVRATRAMLCLQRLAPELKALQERHRVTAATSPEERKRRRHRLNEEIVALYRSRGVSPTAGCLPMLLQLPLFGIVYSTIRGLSHQVVVHGHSVADPLYLRHTSLLYQSIVAHHGQLTSLGVNLAATVISGGGSLVAEIPLALLALALGAISYLQTRGLAQPPAGADDPAHQTAGIQRILTLGLSAISLVVPAGVNLYSLVSSAYRLLQQELVSRHERRRVAAR